MNFSCCLLQEAEDDFQTTRTLDKYGLYEFLCVFLKVISAQLL